MSQQPTDILDWPATVPLFGGTLTWTAEGRCRWIDGEDWTHVFQALTIDDYNFRIAGGYVHVPRQSVQANDDLAWCKTVAVQPHPVWAPRGVYLVPVSEWDRRRHIPIGVRWDTRDEHLVYDKAQDLGWVWPGRRALSMDASEGTMPVPVPSMIRQTDRQE